MGYGPLVRATVGLTGLWTSAEAATDPARPHPFYDATTIFPDHVVGRISAIGALAALIRRRRSGIGARIHVSQAEAVINQLDTLYTTRAAAAHIGGVREDGVLHAVLPCAGDDEWCVVSLRSDADRRAAADLTESDQERLPEALADWTSGRTPAEAAATLQAHGLAAGPMNRPADLMADLQLEARAVFAEMVHPLLDHPLPTEAGPAPYRHIPPAPQHPAPLPGADTRQICRDILAMDDASIERLMADGVLFSTADAEQRGVPG